MGNTNGNEPESKMKRVSLKELANSALQWTLCILLCLITLVFFGTLMIMDTGLGQKLVLDWLALTQTEAWGDSGVFILLFSGPIFALVFVGSVYLYLYPRSSGRVRKRKEARPSLGAHPVIVSGPLGVVTSAELFWIIGMLLFAAWMLIIYLVKTFPSLAEQYPEASTAELWQKRVKKIGLRLGWIGEICLGLLFLPVSRGSILLRLIDIPFEHAAKYHVWLGHFTMTLFTLHGICFIGPWYFEGRLDKIFHWDPHRIAILPGVIALAGGLLMWSTSFQYTRTRAFELFYYTHHLYIVFVVGMVLHVGDFVVGVAFAGIFLFAFDRFLRFCQSRKEVGVLSATLLPCGTYEVVLPKTADLAYNELSFVFLNVPSINRLQWHPFSVSSSPEDSPHHMRLLIKPLGTWTRKLGEAVSKAAISRCPLKLNAGVEGPYGHESSYFLEYEALLLVAGGVGVSPFVAVIRDLLHRYKRNEPGLPHDVTLVWAVKTHKELRILDSLQPILTYPDYALHLKLNVKAYVTKESLEDLEIGEDEVTLTHLETMYDSTAEQRTISHLVGSGNILWISAAIAASIFGYILFTGLVGVFYLFPKDHNSHSVVPWWIRGLIVLAGMVVGVCVFGGSVICIWYLFGCTSKKKARRERDESGSSEALLNGSHEEFESCNNFRVQKLIQRSNTVYGVRPDLQDIFDSCAKRFSGSNIGVLVCGPEGMQSSVAEQCRAFNTVLHHRHQTGFSYHSVSFDL
ncbi:ferric-chelate reductase [Marchantia polymorpha subsp. ruderalis]|uniref:FAD-binding FR-type domain-containing protein n=3 Tax=Marchantia polymorpha TaxID=3197 RepID=A0AAF6AQB1_MARPO|nr:hypothetical protein MARPO_0033s0165 [Marchantia polymorpha]BBM98631.1 hypothetical protein Mp_1g14960 [Marchantia polymorpha subsp. ruderalis]|eukprot:PTQ41778.1 hypothetical protein MARPO_0033s0165 [Marchantia polymorpha]